MDQWSRKHKKCVNCGTTRRKHTSRGYCSKCYPLILRIEQTEAWDMDDADSLKDYPKDIFFCDRERFEILKKGVIRELRKRLKKLHDWERDLNGPVHGGHVEWQLRRVAELAKVHDASMHRGIAGHLNEVFSKEQCREIYRLLIEIEEGVPWRKLDHWHLAQYVVD